MTFASSGFKLLVIIGFLYLPGCTLSIILSPEVRTQHAYQLAKKAGWRAHTIHTSLFTFKTYGSEPLSKTNILTIYIEGDGLAWLSEDRPSDNPTPNVPTGLQMAIQDQGSVAYLARPCQYVFKEKWQHCQSAYWTNLRFSPQVIDAMNQAIDHLKQYYHAKKIVLIGYSGGGTIATLLSTRRHDVIQLMTIAAILDTEDWTSRENLTPLSSSLNPANEWKNLVSIPQIHWVGGQDKVVPKEVAFAFVKRFSKKSLNRSIESKINCVHHSSVETQRAATCSKDSENLPHKKTYCINLGYNRSHEQITRHKESNCQQTLIVIPDFDHVCCWARDWIALNNSVDRPKV